MGIYENTFWAHLKHIQWYGPLHGYIMELTLYHVFKVWFADVHRFHDVFWQARISICPFWLVVDFDTAIWSWKSKSKIWWNVSLWGKSGQTTAPIWSENINLASRELICAPVILKGRHSLCFMHEFTSFFKTCCLGKPSAALRMTSFELHVMAPYNKCH